jgi:hypothetical protein
MSLINPNGMPQEEWLELLQLLPVRVPSYRPGEDWRDYARQLEAANSADFEVPRSDAYTTFQAWADDFYRANG